MYHMNTVFYYFQNNYNKFEKTFKKNNFADQCYQFDNIVEIIV